jgi:PAS domain S-box-containing protein
MADHEQHLDNRPAAEPGPHAAQARFEAAFTSAPIGMALIDMDGRWLQVNDALCRLTGHTRNEFKASTLRDITHPEDIDRDADVMRELLDGTIPSAQIEKRYRHVWGHLLGAVTVSLVRDDRGRRCTSSRKFKTSRNAGGWPLGWSTCSITIS